MSSRYGSSDSRRHSSSRRDSRSPPPSRRRRSRSQSPGPSKPRDPKTLPESFGRVQDSAKPVDDDLNILQRMKTSYDNSPLQNLYKCIKSQKKIKIWTRNYKEVRGVMTGYLVAFDKHWNLVIRDVDEVYLKPKKSKTPFLRDIAPNESLPDMPAKVVRQKKTAEEIEAAAAAAAEKAAAKEEKEGEGKKKKRRKKAKSTSAKRQMEQLFIRGDNIVMVCPIAPEPQAEEGEEGEEEEEEEEGEAAKE